MGLFTRKKSFEEIVWGLSVSGMNIKNNSMFITDSRTDNIVKEFLQKHDVSFKHFRFWENILRYTNSYNVHKAFLNLKSIEFQNSILSALRKPDLFIESYQLPQGGERGENTRKAIEFGFHSLIDNIGVSVMHKEWPGKTALKFLNLLTNDNYNEKENVSTTLYFNMVIYADIMTLHDSIKESLKILKLE